MYLFPAMRFEVFSTRRIFLPPMAGKKWAAHRGRGDKFF
jgi:hypothetical protein